MLTKQTAQALRKKKTEYVAAMKLPDGTVVVANPDERIHAEVYDRICRETGSEPACERGWVGLDGKYISADALDKKSRTETDTFGKRSILI